MKKVIKKYYGSSRTGYLDKCGKFITHSYDDEPAVIYDSGTKKMWCEDGLLHRDDNKPAIIRSNGHNSYYKNGERYWVIDGEEYYDMDEIKEKFKNNILKLKNVNGKILKENNIDAICIDYCKYLILDQAQYNLAIFKFI